MKIAAPIPIPSFNPARVVLFSSSSHLASLARLPFPLSDKGTVWSARRLSAGLPGRLGIRLREVQTLGAGTIPEMSREPA